MKTLILSVILTLLTAASPAFGQQSQNVSMTDNAVRIMGRTVIEKDSATLGFPGQEIELRFTGSSSVKMNGEVLSGDAWFNVYIDGRSLPVLKLGSGRYSTSLADTLDASAEHMVRIVRRSESGAGVIRVDGFTIDDGAKVLPAKPLPSRKILAIGDSITCGYNVELLPPGQPGYYPEKENAELSYAWQLAKDFDAQIQLVSYSGRGITRDWRGLTTSLSQEVFNDAGNNGKVHEIVTAGDFFERALPDDPASVWDHSKYQPDLILICLGQNDYSQISLPAADFADAYIKFVDRVHQVYPKASIVVLSSPMAETSRTDGWQPRGKALEQAISIMDQHYIRQGDPIVMPIFVSRQPGTELDSHPIASQQRAIADEVKPIIKFLTGWDK